MDVVALALSQPAARVKRVTHPLTAPNSNAAASALDRVQRIMMALPVNTTRWRLRIANRNLLANTIFTTPCTITNVYHGSPVYLTSGTSTTRFNGTATAALTQVLTGPLTVPVDGSDLVTSWVSGASDQFSRHTPKVLSWGLTSLNSGTGIANGNSYQGGGAADSTKAGDAVPPTMTINAGQLYLDVRVEFEYKGTEPVILHIGDSITLGYGDGTQGYTSPQQSSWSHESWPGAAGLLGEYTVVNLGIGSASTGTFATSSNYCYSRADLATTVPDAAVIALGANDLGASFGTVAVNLNAIIDNCRAAGIRKIYLCTVMPRALTTIGTLQAAASAAATSIVSSYSPGNVDVLIGSGSSQEVATVSGASGNGPYTLTVGALANDHVAGEPIASSNELTRRRVNTWIRQVPYGISGVLGLEWLMEAAPNSAECDPRFISADGLHPLRAGYQHVAMHVAALGGRVRFGS